MDIKRIQQEARRRGLLAAFHPAVDESVDDEIAFSTLAGEQTGLAIQLSGRFFVATQWLEAEEAMWFGKERRSALEAFRDLIERL